jgi:aspartate/methionine/tyrosine aminotransferase
VLALVDSDDEVVLFPPYYFNHLMALQMTGGSARVVLGCVDEKLVPNMKWFEEYLRW